MRRRFVLGLLALGTMGVCLGCENQGADGPVPPGPHHPGAPPGAGGQAPPDPSFNPMMLANTPEDLTLSWDDGLSEVVPPIEQPEECPDKDGDGFQDAWTCPLLPPDKADCDDSSPDVTPETERFVRSGPFIMGSASSHAGLDERPVHVVQLSNYCMDRVTVSRAAYASWKEATPPPQDADLPEERVSWEDALDYCVSQGKSLATEAQWEKAARGGCEFGQSATACDPEDMRPYPWGTEMPSCDLANHRLTVGKIRLCRAKAAPVGASLNTGPYGHIQLSGNVWEWVADTYHPKVYHRTPARQDPLGPNGGEEHVLRGGSWNTFTTNMRVANRMSGLLEGSVTGIRCARSRTEGIHDPIAPMRIVTLSGEIIAEEGVLEGRALFVTAFDKAFASEGQGPLVPGQSPAAEMKVIPNGLSRQSFRLRAPVGGPYLLMAALDANVSPLKNGWESPTSTGGIGIADQNPIMVEGDVSGITITIREAPPGELAPPGGMQPH